MARILIVDDEELVRNILRAYLRASGHTLVEAVDGMDALAVHHLQPADLLVTDNHMPRMGGAELVGAVREETPDVKIILISGLAVDPELADSVDGVLNKPFSREELIREIERVLKPAVAA